MTADTPTPREAADPDRVRTTPVSDDVPTELRALAGELHRWAPDPNALAVRDRLLTAARATAPAGPAASGLLATPAAPTEPEQ